jgi:outer membrane protein OmpA-like peptidoglycan-associated protein
MKFFNALLFGLLMAVCINPAWAAKLKPSATNAVLHVSVTNYQDAGLANQTLTFVDAEGNQLVETSNSNGEFSILIPKGKTYDIFFESLSGPYKVGEVSVPKNAGEGNWNVQFDNLTFELRNVLFDTGKSTLKPSSYSELNNLVKGLQMNPAVTIEIAGHTDNVGGDDFNMELSQARAASVLQYLLEKGISANRLTSNGYGKTQPIASNDTESGRAQNRRTEVRIISQ